MRRRFLAALLIISMLASFMVPAVSAAGFAGAPKNGKEGATTAEETIIVLPEEEVVEPSEIEIPEGAIERRADNKWYVKTTVITAMSSDVKADSKREEYVSSTWVAYVNARTSVKQGYSTEAEAAAAYRAFAAAVDGLEAAVTKTPAIEWHRTNEPTGTGTVGSVFNTSYGDLVLNVLYIPKNDINHLTWGSHVNQILSLPTTATFETWDYNTNQQRSDATKRNNINVVAATWNEHERGAFNGGSDRYNDGSVRKFDGTFIWPAGYDLDDVISVVSENNSFYNDIYTAVEANPTLFNRFAGNHVLAVNDDIFVFIYKDTDTLTSANYLDHLVFWTGSSGKGKWSSNDTGNDWGRTTPAMFNGKSATPAYYRTMPNNADVDSNDTNRTNRGYSDMEFSGGWYSLVDTSSFATTLRNLYGSEDLTGQKMHIAVFAFDNSGVGGMDKLNLTFTKKATTATTVTVNYWLNDVGSTDAFVGTSTMTDVQIGTEINLSAGTNTNELNYMKATAESKYNVSVKDGVQVAAITVTKNGDNVVDVVYVQNAEHTVVVEAGSAVVAYTGSEHTVNTVSVKLDENAAITATANDVALDSEVTVHGVQASGKGTLPGIYPVTFVNSSAYVTRNNQTAHLNNYVVTRRTGTLTITYDPADLVLTYDFAGENVYDKLDAVEKAATTITVSDESVAYVKDGLIYYVPNTINTGDEVTLTLTYAGGYSVDKKVTFVPAANVLYEEYFVTTAPGTSDWVKPDEYPEIVIKDNDTAFGYTNALAYASTTPGFSAGSVLKAQPAVNTPTAEATFTFTGTGFDLISECASDTGMLFVTVKKGDQIVSMYLVDTYFSGTFTAYQVPVVRMMDLDYGTYTVSVKGFIYGDVPNGTNAVKRAQNSIDSILDAFDVSAAAVEVSFVDENSVLNGGCGNSIVGDSVNATARNNASCIYIDAIRVYNPVKPAPAVYEKEANAKYESLYDCVMKNSLYATNGGVLYIEGSTLDMSDVNLAIYHNNGPKNELYLESDCMFAVALDGVATGSIVQVSAKAVTAGAKLNGQAVTGTEMYYDLEVKTAGNISYVEIAASEGTLSVSVLKISSGTSVSDATEELAKQILDGYVAAPFAPEVFKVSCPSTVKQGKIVPISVSASKEVAYVIFVNSDGTEHVIESFAYGKIGAEESLRTFSNAVQVTKTSTYKLIAVDFDGNRSLPVNVTISVK